MLQLGQLRTLVIAVFLSSSPVSGSLSDMESHVLHYLIWLLTDKEGHTRKGPPFRRRGGVMAMLVS